MICRHSWLTNRMSGGLTVPSGPVCVGMTELDMNGSHAAQHGSQQAPSLHRGGWEGAPAPAQVIM
jgi:hypothetical protein